MESTDFEKLVTEIGESLLRRAAPPPPSPGWTPAAVAALIDHTLLKPEATAAEIRRICEEARAWRFASVCINPFWAGAAVGLLQGSGVKVCTVAGFPLGASSTAAKRTEAETAILAGAAEIDMVLNIGALKSGDHDTVRNDIRGLVEVCRRGCALLKVILETCLLTTGEKETACLLAMEAGADFVKTSTGFSGSGATVEDVSLMRRVVGDRLGVKASGGIRTLHDLKAMVEAGATRIGASASVQIVQSAAR